MNSYSFPQPVASQTGRQSLAQPIILCFSHLRWDFVHQRPQHLLSKAAGTYRVYFIEEPEFAPVKPHFRMRVADSNVVVLTPVFDQSADAVQMQQTLIEGLQNSLDSHQIIHWFYTPMAMRFARRLPCDLCIYDCMDELSAFRFAPPDLGKLERDLLDRADLVFTGGRSLYASKRRLHNDVHCFPSSVDTRHFGKARTALADPADQRSIKGPRIGFLGVIDERIDLDLIALASQQLPDVHFIMLGPTAKIDPADLPQAENLHWLGRKEYDELPAYMAHWDAAWMPFALNESTRFISPTKTPEFLAAGLPVTSTAIADVVATYGEKGLVQIADAESVADCLRASLAPQNPDWLPSVDQYLATQSWTATWKAMQQLMASRMAMTGETVNV